MSVTSSYKWSLTSTRCQSLDLTDLHNEPFTWSFIGDCFCVSKYCLNKLESEMLARNTAQWSYLLYVEEIIRFTCLAHMIFVPFIFFTLILIAQGFWDFSSSSDLFKMFSFTEWSVKCAQSVSLASYKNTKGEKFIAIGKWWWIIWRV